MDTTNNDSNIEVILSDPSVFHCFKIVFGVKPTPDAIERVPLEIFLHTTQAIDLLHQLSLALCEKHRQDSAELLRVKTGMSSKELERSGLIAK